MEAATGLLDKAASITIIEPAYPLKPVLGEKVAQRLVKLHQSKGVKFVVRLWCTHTQSAQVRL